jgi:acyl-coenzyme A synthetase/AMP-(fatty) acid ligase
VQKFDIHDDSESIPIGKPTHATQLTLLSEDLKRIVKKGEVGKLMLGGAQLSHGYWKRPDLNENVFHAHPISKERLYDSGDLAKVDEKGQLLWMGRADQQVNINGYRVELMEIEGHANTTGLFSECAIVATGSPLTLHAIVSLREKVEPSDLLKKLNEKLTQVLPTYMLIQNLHIMESLPRNTNGKIDRKTALEAIPTP